MKIIHTSAELKQWRKAENNSTVGFVPTMGALHSGHSSLLKKAAKECDIVALSILVNPTQFGDQKDFKTYPKTLESDTQLAREAGADVIFAPSAEDLYGGVPSAPKVDYGDITSSFEAAQRPGHFDGVVAVVGKLFDVVMPQKAYFGEKDLQQVAVVRALAKGKYESIEIVSCELVRETTGLAKSSRNSRLTEDGRNTALKLFQAISQAKKDIDNGSDRDLVVQSIGSLLDSEPDMNLEYLHGVNEISFCPENSSEAWTHIVVAAEVEGVRLIDNIRL
jgi:pantoate--beta-alanine ligase